MKIFNECIFDETMYSSVIRDKDITFYFRRLVVQKFNISIHEGEKKIFCGEKNYSFIPIDEDSAKNCQFYLGNDVIKIEYFDKKIKKLMINEHEIKGFSSIDFQNKYKIDIPTKIKSKGGKSKKSEKGKKVMIILVKIIISKQILYLIIPKMMLKVIIKVLFNNTILIKIN